MKKKSKFFSTKINLVNILFHICVSIILFFIVILFTVNTSSDLPTNLIGKTMGSLTMLLFIMIFGGLAQRIQNTKMIYWIIATLLLINFIIAIARTWAGMDGIISFTGNNFFDVGLVASSIIYVFISIILIFSGVNGYFYWIVVFMIFINLLIITFGSSLTVMQSFPGQIIFMAFCLGLAYYPRRMNFLPYLWPRSAMHEYHPPSKQSSDGFTLIELLIAIAMMSIFFTGALHTWAGFLKAQKESELRTQINFVLDSQMSALHQQITTGEAISTELPIPLSEFDVPDSLTGRVDVVELSDAQGLELTVHLTLDIIGDQDRHFRLVSFSHKRGQS